MIAMTIHGLQNGTDVAEGTIILDGGGLRPVPSSPNGARVLSKLLDRPVTDHRTGRTVYPHDDPALWLWLLPFYYRSAYLRAAPASFLNGF